MNCTTDDRRTLIYFEEPEPAERERAVWRDIDRAFSEPVSRTDDVADYAPTQMLAEIFRQQGLDGVGYRSAMGPGRNIALFDLESADVLNCSLVRIDQIGLTFSEIANPYFVSQHYSALAAAEQSESLTAVDLGRS
jgi:hypothetical protein